VEFVIAGKFSATAEARGVALDAEPEVYRRVRNHVALCLLAGFGNACDESRHQLKKVEQENRELKVREPWEGYKSANCVTVPVENYDN